MYAYFLCGGIEKHLPKNPQMLKWSIKSNRHLLSDEIIMSPQYQNSGFHGDDCNIEEVTPYRYKNSDRSSTALLLWTEMSISKDND